MPKHSAILSAYPNCSIHANHIDIVRFSGPRDAGYIRVRDQLWLWVDVVQRKLEEQNTEVRQNPNQMLSHYSGTVFSSGGPVFQGSQNAGRDLNLNFGPR